jgi:hypothetical protein
MTRFSETSRLVILIMLSCYVSMLRVIRADSILQSSFSEPLSFLSQANGPYIANTDVIIHKTAKLIIEAGTELRFAKGKQLVVHGTLEAKGNETNRIKFTKIGDNELPNFYNNNNNNNINSTNNTTINLKKNNLFVNERFRLVEGDTIQDGKLQIFYNNKWNYVCSTQFK